MDESGFLLLPSVRRTWAPRRRTPLLRCAEHGGKISAISAITLSPQHKRIALYARFHAEKNIRSGEVAAFLRQVLKHLRHQVVLLWDSANPHKAACVKEFLQKHPRLHAYPFPGYAPELNPDESVWNHLRGALANSNPRDVHDLKEFLHPPLQWLRQSPKLLWSCIHASDLPWA